MHIPIKKSLRIVGMQIFVSLFCMYTNTYIYPTQIYLFITFMLVAIFLLKGSVCPTPRNTRTTRLVWTVFAPTPCTCIPAVDTMCVSYTYFIKMLNLWAVSEVLDIHVLAPTIKSLCKIYIAYELSRSKTHTCDLFKIDERS